MLWQLCGKCVLERTNNWYENFKILWDFTVQCDRNIVFIDKKETEVVIIDVAIPGDDRAKDEELEKLEKFQLWKDEIASLAHAKIIVVPVVIGAVSVNFKKYR